MPPKRKVKQTARATPAKTARHTRASAALGAPPPSTSVNFEDAGEMQEIQAEVMARSAVQDAGASPEAVVAASGCPSRVTWEQQVDARLANTEPLLLEMHGIGMLQSALTNNRSEGVDWPAPSTAIPVQEQDPVPWPSTSGRSRYPAPSISHTGNESALWSGLEHIGRFPYLHWITARTPSHHNNNSAICGISPRATLSGNFNHIHTFSDILFPQN